MGFGKRGRDLPVDVRNADFKAMHKSQMWVLSDWMACRRQVAALKTYDEQTAYLKARCLENAARAQQGYDIIVLQKDPAVSGAVPADVEKRTFQILTEVIVKHKDAIGEQAFKAVTDATDAIKSGLEAAAKAAVKAAAENARPIVIKDGSKARKIKGVMPPEFERMVQLASVRIPILLVGPAGCGKTYLAEKLAEALDLDASDQSCSEGMSESVFNGFLLPVGKGGSFEHVASPFLTRYEEGGVMLLDEMDAGDSNLFTYINKAIANNSYTVPQRYLKPVVKKHEDFVLIAAANTFGHGADAMYVGRNQLDAATLDRFKVGLIAMDYSREVEMNLAPAEICNWAWAIRDKIRSNKLRRVMSTRVIKDLATMTERYGWKRSEWERAYFTGWSDADRRQVGG